MSERIEDLLHRRTDLSTFLVHFTRDSDDGATISQDNLLKILKTGRLEARNSYGMAMRLAERFPEVAKTQQAVCFTETPIEHAWMMCRQIADRSFRFNGYGLAFTKSFARREGANPVWYLDISQRGREWLTEPVNRLVDAAEALAAGDAGVTDGSVLASADILRLTPFSGAGRAPVRHVDRHLHPRQRRFHEHRAAQGDRPGAAGSGGRQ